MTIDADGVTVNPRSTLSRLQPGRADARLVSFGSGWEHQVWAVDDDLVLRVNPTADRAACAAAVERDVRLLTLVGNHLTVPVGADVAQLLSELRTVPLASAIDVAGPPPSSTRDWLEQARADYEGVAVSCPRPTGEVSRPGSPARCRTRLHPTRSATTTSVLNT